MLGTDQVLAEDGRKRMTRWMMPPNEKPIVPIWVSLPGLGIPAALAVMIL